MPFFWKKQKIIEKTIDEYFNRCDHCFNLFEQAFKIFLSQGQDESFQQAVEKTHEAESSADDLRREIELTLYGKALLPESRGDLLGLLEAYDRLPNVAETVLYTISCQNMVIPKNLIHMVRQLVEVNLQAYYLVRKAVDCLLNNPRTTLHTTKEVDEKESESDRIERKIICEIFSSTDMDNGMKLMLKEMILLIGSIADRAERAADRIGIVAIKRQI